jgi:hypothetical protein
MNAGHLARRFVKSLDRRPPGPEDVAWAHSWLTDGERQLWDSMPETDRRHSIEVTMRFSDLRPWATRAEMAGSLLHDVGKTASGFGTFGRVVATLVGPRTKRLRRYHAHEVIGADMAAAAGSDPATVRLIGGRGPAAADLRAADDSI